MSTPINDAAARYIAESISAEYVAEAERLARYSSDMKKRAELAEKNASVSAAVLTETKVELGSTRNLYDIQAKDISALEEFKKNYGQKSADRMTFLPYIFFTGLLVGGLIVGWMTTLTDDTVGDLKNRRALNFRTPAPPLIEGDAGVRKSQPPAVATNAPDINFVSLGVKLPKNYSKNLCQHAPK